MASGAIKITWEGKGGSVSSGVSGIALLVSKRFFTVSWFGAEPRADVSTWPLLAKLASKIDLHSPSLFKSFL